MAVFYYKATNSAGKVEEGQLEVDSKAQALGRLERMGLFPLSVADKQAPKQINFSKINLESLMPKKRVGTGQVLEFTDKLAALLKAGLPLAKALKLIIETTSHEALHEVVKQVLKDVSAGQSLAESLAKHPRVFERLFVNMVKTGEAAGVLEQILESLRDYLEIRQNLKSFLISSLIYPSILALTGLGTVLVLVLFVLPKFQEVFDQVGQELPFVTSLLVDVTSFLTDYKYIIIPLLVGGFIFFRRWKNTPEGQEKWDAMLLRLPLLGTILVEIEVNRIANALGILLRNSVSLLDAMSITKEIAENTVFRKAMEPLIKGVKKGEGMSKAMTATGIFPKMAVQLVAVGEETGAMGEMFTKISNIYQANLEKTIKRLLAMFEPVMILVMFVVVGFIVAAMLMAVTSLSTSTI